MDPGAEVAAFNAGLVAVLCAIIAAASFRVLQRTGNRAIGSVIAGFVLLSLKNLVKAILLASEAGAAEEGWKEFAFSLADLVAVALIAAPLLLRDRRGAP